MKLFSLACGLILIGATGCTQIVAPIDAIPAAQVPPQFLVAPKGESRPVDFSRLRRKPAEKYIIDKGDVLGIFIDGVLGNADEAPPTRLPDGTSDLPPAIGFPIPVRENGTLALPLIKPVHVSGLSIDQIELAILRAYSEAGVLAPDEEDIEALEQQVAPDQVDDLPADGCESPLDDADDPPKANLEPKGAFKALPKTKVAAISTQVRIIVTLMQKRTVRVVVVRQDDFADQANEVTKGGLSVQRTVSGATSQSLRLPEGNNDLMEALSLTGGLPGFRAKNEVKIYRGGMNTGYAQAWSLAYGSDSCNCDPCQIPDQMPESDNALKIPLRLKRGQIANFTEADIILNDGDIVVVESREKEVFYTGGLLGGGEYPLPRDYDLDVLTAMSVAEQGYGSMQQGRGGGGGFGQLAGSIGNIPPGQLIVLRQLPGNQQIAIEIDLPKAINNPNTRILVAPGDKLILRHKTIEEVLNFSLGAFFTFGIRELLR